MTIQIKRQLTHEQYIKLFSNPISGIACVVDDYNRDHRVIHCCQNIRYSKSMLLRALEFWFDRIFQLYLKVTRAYNPLEPMKDLGEEIMSKVDVLQFAIDYVKRCPDSFLFSHRYIMDLPEIKHNNAIELQLKMVQEKHKLGARMYIQRRNMDPYFIYNGLPYDLYFTVFPNEHPYIKRQKIVEVGKTSKGNTFVIKA